MVNNLTEFEKSARERSLVLNQLGSMSSSQKRMLNLEAIMPSSKPLPFGKSRGSVEPSEGGECR